MNSLSYGLRRTSPESLDAQLYARRYHDADTKKVTRIAALTVAKRAAAAMGLKSSKIALIDQLFGCSKAVDWDTTGVAPVIWPSNDRLARSMGICISTMKHHLNGLVKAGLIAYSDGPTYQRRGRRDKEGIIVEGYGIDLSPIAVRYDELAELVEAVEHEARQWKRYSYRRTVVRKEIQSLILSAQEISQDVGWGRAQARLDMLREHKPESLEDLANQVEAFELLQCELEDTYDDMILDVNSNSTVSKFQPLQTTPEPSHSVYSRTKSRDSANAQYSTRKTAYGSIASRKKHEKISTSEQYLKNPKQVLEQDIQHLSLPLMKSACPKLEDYVPGVFESWRSLRDAGHELCLQTGINPQVWLEARSTLGVDIAIAAVAVTVQKTDLGLVSSPGGYLRTLTQRGRDGDLNISRSLFALADNSDDSKPSNPDEETFFQGFPVDGSIAYSKWAELSREHTPKPTPDTNLVANAFRSWIKQRGIEANTPNIEQIFISFCRKYRLN